MRWTAARKVKLLEFAKNEYAKIKKELDNQSRSHENNRDIPSIVKMHLAHKDMHLAHKDEEEHEEHEEEHEEHYQQIFTASDHTTATLRDAALELLYSNDSCQRYIGQAKPGDDPYDLIMDERGECYSVEEVVAFINKHDTGDRLPPHPSALDPALNPEYYPPEMNRRFMHRAQRMAFLKTFRFAGAGGSVLVRMVLDAVSRAFENSSILQTIANKVRWLTPPTVRRLATGAMRYVSWAMAHPYVTAMTFTFLRAFRIYICLRSRMVTYGKTFLHITFGYFEHFVKKNLDDFVVLTGLAEAIMQLLDCVWALAETSVDVLSINIYSLFDEKAKWKDCLKKGATYLLSGNLFKVFSLMCRNALRPLIPFIHTLAHLGGISIKNAEWTEQKLRLVVDATNVKMPFFINSNSQELFEFRMHLVDCTWLITCFSHVSDRVIKGFVKNTLSILGKADAFGITTWLDRNFTNAADAMIDLFRGALRIYFVDMHTLRTLRSIMIELASMVRCFATGVLQTDNPCCKDAMKFLTYKNEKNEDTLLVDGNGLPTNDWSTELERQELIKMNLKQIADNVVSQAVPR
jgi:hypothetical protein